jgi:hypothetical protein
LIQQILLILLWKPIPEKQDITENGKNHGKRGVIMELHGCLFVK